MKDKGLFITGTDTGVGKTYVACGIATALHQKGIDVGVMKPAETGCRLRRGELVPQDAIDLAKAAQAGDRLEDINPFRFRTPVAPWVASRLEQKRIDVRTILRRYEKLSSRHEFMIVEGAGGILVPLTARLSFLDLVKELGLPVLITARPNLGTINHTLLTVQALERKSIPIAGICINDRSGISAGVAEKTNPAVIAQLTSVPVFPVIRQGSEDFGLLASGLF